MGINSYQAAPTRPCDYGKCMAAGLLPSHLVLTETGFSQAVKNSPYEYGRLFGKDDFENERDSAKIVQYLKEEY